MSEEQFRRCVQAASAFQEAHEWARAGQSWIEAAQIATSARAIPSARQCLLAAAEAFRRDDRLRAAERALSVLLTLEPEPAQEAVARVHLASVLSSLGRGREALDAFASAEIDAAPPPLRAVGLDIAVSLAWQWEGKEAVRALIERLRQIEPGGPAGPATRFRSAQLLRADGDLPSARAAFEALCATMARSPGPGADAGIAAALIELAELDLLEDRPAEAVDRFARAKQLEEEGRRLSLAYTAEAGRIRALVARDGAPDDEAALGPLRAGLTAGLAHAAERGMVPLEHELTTALGAAISVRSPREARARLQAVVRGAGALGDRGAAGRARLAWATLVPEPEPERRALLEAAARDLMDDLPLLERVQRALDAAS